MALVYVNGDLVAEHDARLSTFDHGLVVGDGVFETIRLTRGQPFALRRHLDRLQRSATGLGIGDVDRQRVADAVAIVVEDTDFEEGRIRVTVTAGRGPLGSGRLDGPLSIVVATAPTDHADVTSAAVSTVPWPRNERGALAGLKTISYGENVRALAWASSRGSDEAIFANCAGNLCEGSGSNVFVVINGELVTPPLAAGCLAGVTRGLVLESNESAERDVPIAAFSFGAIEEAFLTSAIRGVQPIATIDDRGVSDSPGPVTKAAMERFSLLRATELDP
jgi:branched-chain amino acid aminotransferase